jgi:hypothetical protein
VAANARFLIGRSLRGCGRSVCLEGAFPSAAKVYLWKIFLPLMMITLVPIVVFWIDVKEFDWIVKVLT